MLEKDRDIIKKVDYLVERCNLEDLVDISLKANIKEIDKDDSFIYKLSIKNNSDKDIFDLNIFQDLEKNIRVRNIILDSKDIISNRRDNLLNNFYIDRLKAKERKDIDIVVDFKEFASIDYIKSNVKLKAKYFDNDNCANNILLRSKPCNIGFKTPEVNLIKECFVSEAIVGDIVEFSIIVENTGDLDVENVVVKDILKEELEFVKGSIKIDNIPCKDENILSGVDIGFLGKYSRKQILFKAKVLSRPRNRVIKNISVAQYRYRLSCDNKLRDGEVISNENFLDVDIAQVDIVKKIDKKSVSLGEKVLVSVDIINNGTLEAVNLLLAESISPLFEVADKRIVIDGHIINNIDLSKGILIGDLKVGHKRSISYMLKYTKAGECSVAYDKSTLSYYYRQKSGLIFEGDILTNNLEIITNINNFKYISISDKLFKEHCNPEILEIDNLNSNIKILGYHLVKTIKNKSNDGQILTGNKIVFNALVTLTVEYTAKEDNLVYTFTRKIPISSFLILPEDFKLGSSIKLDYKIEHINFKKRDDASLYFNICVLFLAKIKTYKS